MCLLIAALILGPRTAAILFWLFRQERWELAFDSFLVGFFGILIVPWVTMAYVVTAPGGVDGLDYVLLALAGVIDLASLAGSGGARSRR